MPREFVPRGRLKHQRRSLYAHPARRPAVDWGRPLWLKREAKVSRKRWCRPEAYRRASLQACTGEPISRGRRASFFVQPHAALIYLVSRPFVVVVVGRGTSGDAPPPELCRSGRVGIFPSPLTIFTQCSLGPAASQLCARRGVRTPHSCFLCRRCSAPMLQYSFCS